MLFSMIRQKLTNNKSDKAILLDRDGVIVIDKHLISSVDMIELIPGVASAIKKLNTKGYLVIVITNQSVVARNLCSIKDVEVINLKMVKLLKEEGAFIDAIYSCPHHPDKGFFGENPDFKIKCNCRKPDIGMFTQAISDFNFDVKKSYLIGDQDRDIQFGKRAGLKTIHVQTGKDLNHCEADYDVKNLSEAVKSIIV